MKGGEQHFMIKTFNKYIKLVRVFMFIPWLAAFILNFPPPQALRESRYKALEVSENLCPADPRSFRESPLNG